MFLNMARIASAKASRHAARPLCNKFHHPSKKWRCENFAAEATSCIYLHPLQPWIPYYAPKLSFIHRLQMARTYHKSKMEDIFLFSTSEALEELELFNPTLPVTGEDGFFEYDLYNCIEEADVKPSLVAQSNLLAEDLLQDFDIEAGDGLLDSDWMTEKLEFTNTEPVLPTESDPFSNLGVDLTTLEPVVASEPESTATLENASPALTEQSAVNIFANVNEILERLCADRRISFTVEQPSAPSSPLQSVPDVEMNSPTGVLSPKSDASEESTPLAFSDVESSSGPSSPDISPVEKAAPVILPSVTTRPKSMYFAPYSKEKPAKVKSPQQKKRKREQNKDAATRYRIKKREEQDTVQKELAGLEKDNVELKEQVSSLSKEIEYLKNLMLEVYKTKLQKQTLLASQIN